MNGLQIPGHPGGARFPPSTDRIPVSGTVAGGLVKRLVGSGRQHGEEAFFYVLYTLTLSERSVKTAEMPQKLAFLHCNMMKSLFL